MNASEINEEYFKWLYSKIKDSCYMYSRLIKYLYSREFIPTIEDDEDRVDDGLKMRRRFSEECGYEEEYLSEYLDEPCSILEMMLALSFRCEESIMDDPSKGNRTSQWFWGMIMSLGLGPMRDDNYDEDFVIKTIDEFIKRNYSPDGYGGLYFIRGCKYDMRIAGIWRQMCWYLDTLS